MSAFIVKNETINRIVTHLHLTPSKFSHIFTPLGFDLSNADGLQKVASALLALNCKAVGERYGKSKNGQPTIQFKFERANIAQVYKSIECLRYQCAEGSCPKENMFIALTKTLASVANQIIAELPEYKAAQWSE